MEVETLESRVKNLTQCMKPNEVMDLECSGCTAESLSGLLDQFVNLEILSLPNVGLASLKGFPDLPELCELDLTGNQIAGGLEVLEGCQKLFVLKLASNKIADLETIKPLAKLEVLRELDLSNCDVCQVDNYREKVFELIKSLIYLDGFDKDNKAVADSEYYKENGEDEEEGSEEEDDEEEDVTEDEVGLSYLQKSDLGDDDSKDYEAPEDDEDDDEDVSDEDEEIDEDEVKEVVAEFSEESNSGLEPRRGRKRKSDDVAEDSNQ